MTHTSLYSRSVQIILDNQHPNGAYVAGPGYPTYEYCWLRDGAYIAYAMDCVEQHASASRFHDWVATTILGHAEAAREAVETFRRGGYPQQRCLHARYPVEGRDTDEAWPNFPPH